MTFIPPSCCCYAGILKEGIYISTTILQAIGCSMSSSFILGKPDTSIPIPRPFPLLQYHRSHKQNPRQGYNGQYTHPTSKTRSSKSYIAPSFYWVPNDIIICHRIQTVRSCPIGIDAYTGIWFRFGLANPSSCTAT